MDYDDDFDGADLIAQYLSARNRPIRMHLSFPDGVASEVLLPQRISGLEAVCDGIELRIYCLSLDARLPLKTLIGLPVEVQLVTDQGRLRSLCGIVAEASQGESDGGLATYQLVMRDALAILDLSVGTRVFLNKTELEVVQTVLDEVRRNNPVLAATFEYEIDTALGLRDYPARQQIIQYNEGTGAFLRRLLKRRGIAWFFRAGRSAHARAPEAGASGPATPAHTMVLFQDARRLKQSSAGVIRFHRASATEERDTITAWSGVRTLRPGRVSRYSWDYANPRGTDFMSASLASEADQGARGKRLTASLDHYLTEAPHVRDSYDELDALARQALARSDFEAKCYHAEGGVRDCAPGEYFSLAGHPEIDGHPDEERQFIILSQHITAQNNLPKGFDARVERLFARNRWSLDAADLPLAGRNWFDSGELRFQARLTCVRRDIAFVPAYDPRVDLPRPQMQSAIVVGPPGAAVHCDAQGRVKVRFGGMREEDHAHAEGAGASGSDRDSAWVRVASSWAGNGAGGYFGALALPRPGTEVLIAFLGGDPDKPIIIGQLYNMIARPPRLGADDLPGNRYLSGIKSSEIDGARANQLRLDDTPGQISAQLASEHGRSELNLGWLSQPRAQGVGQPRGEGAELTTDAQLALRAGKGMLLSAWGRLNGGGKQLDRADYLALMEDCLELFRSLGQYAAAHQGFASDEQAQGELQSAVKQWDAGSNTAPKGSGGGAAAIGITAPAGISFASSKAIVSYAAANIDSVAQQHLQMTAGQRCTVNAGKGISLFAQHGGLNAIAHFGKLLIQSQHDNMDINAAKSLTLTAMAHTIELIAEDGSFIRLGDGITLGSSKPLKFNAPDFVFNDPQTMATQLPVFEAGAVSERFTTRYQGGTFASGEDADAEPQVIDDAAPAQELDIVLSDDSVGESVSDALGKANEITRDAMHLAGVTVKSKRG